jgi:transposase
MAFVMVLSWSRRIFLRFYLNAQLANFLRGHEAAFQAWNGLPRVLLYDNLKSAVLERQGEAIRFHPTLRAASGGGVPGQREGPRRTGHPLRPRQLLRRPPVAGPG